MKLKQRSGETSIWMVPPVPEELKALAGTFNEAIAKLNDLERIKIVWKHFSGSIPGR